MYKTSLYTIYMYPWVAIGQQDSILANILQKSLLRIPSQVMPFPVYPDWQWHKKLPIVLVQLALVSQGNVALEHSSRSGN